ncbi:MAG: hypothetical protein G01um101438_633 [Parcubacteria group bacterium Gr01-1014_38]|nr:MAG: hypothetical protein G01um101438_633 [Parcubacteria group bacterium Gr01-1014_38]
MLEFRRRAGDILNQIFYRKERILVRRGRKDMAVLIPLEDYQTYIADADTERYTDKELQDMFRRDAVPADLRSWALQAKPRRR